MLSLNSNFAKLQLYDHRERVFRVVDIPSTATPDANSLPISARATRWTRRAYFVFATTIHLPTWVRRR